MKKFNVKFQREFEVQIDAESIETAQTLARQVLAQFPANSTKLLSILPFGYTEAPEQPSPPSKPFGRPNGGGTPGTPVVRTEVLVDQIAEAALTRFGNRSSGSKDSTKSRTAGAFVRCLTGLILKAVDTGAAFSGSRFVLMDTFALVFAAA